MTHPPCSVRGFLCLPALWYAALEISFQYFVTRVVNWLSDFGVEHFITQMPADLEYDPQLSVVAEWRDPETLFRIMLTMP